MTPCTKTAYPKRSGAMKNLHSMRRSINQGNVPSIPSNTSNGPSFRPTY